MLRFIFRRVLQLIPVILSVMVILFTILYFTPGDPARIVLGQEVTQEAIANFRAVHGLDDPYLIQLGRYLYRALFHWDLGYSYAMKS